MSYKNHEILKQKIETIKDQTENVGYTTDIYDIIC